MQQTAVAVYVRLRLPITYTESAVVLASVMGSRSRSQSGDPD